LRKSNMSATVTMCWTVTASSRLFTITGFGGTSATQPQLNITYLPPCTGQPAAGVATAPAGVCSGTSFALTATGVTTGGGITYQWEKFNTGTSAWDPVAGATTASYTVSGGITVASQYHLVTNLYWQQHAKHI